jgi:dTDP-4-dehydrorhamnose reductase
MIGSGVTRFLSTELEQIIEVNRSGIAVSSGNQVIKFDVSKHNVETLIEHIPKGSTILNFIGVIRHKIDETRTESVLNASKVNSEFPKNLTIAASKKNCSVIQVGTDCIFSGRLGDYTESSLGDPIDVYGETKLQGELVAENLMTLRVSVIGREWKSHVELMDWVLRAKIQAELTGYKNHFWNGITTLHLARVIKGILSESLFRAGTFHLVPQDKKSKLGLIVAIAALGDRRDLIIHEFEDSHLVDRTLSTDFPEFNEILWGAAGFSTIPTIDLMVEEYFAWCRS